MSTKLHHDVRAFHTRFGHPVREYPTVPTPEEMRFRLKLITEEYLELLTACGVRIVGDGWDIADGLRQVIGSARLLGDDVDLPEMVDAMADLSYVLEGTAAVIGVDMEPVCTHVHRANMAKDPVYVRQKDEFHDLRVPDPTAQPTKPAAWRPPDVAGELRRQGWDVGSKP